MQAGVIVWFTGIPGSGKSHHARAVREALGRLGVRCVLLDGDEVRGLIKPRPGYEPAEREAFYETLGNLAAHLARDGAVVLVAATAHLRAFREHARRQAPGAFVEVHVAVPEATVKTQDEGREARVHGVGLRGVPGQDVAYEAPEAPELLLDLGNRQRAVELVFERLGPWLAGAAGAAVEALAREVYVSVALRTGEHEAAQRALCERWGLIARPELHVTLLYLGDVEVEKLWTLHGKLMQLGWDRLRLRVTGAGATVGQDPLRLLSDEGPLREPAREPRVAWWSVDGGEALGALREAAVEACAASGLTTQYARTFYSPHVTLGSACAPGEDGSRYDQHAVAKGPSLSRAEAPWPLALAAAHITSARLHPASLLPLYRFG